MNKFLLKFKKPTKSVMIQYKSIIFPDFKPYRINLHVDKYSTNINDDEQIFSSVLTTQIYPFFERQHQILKHVSMNEQEKIYLLKEINAFTIKYNLLYRDIDVYLDPNGFNFFSPYNQLLKRKYISDFVKD